MSSAQAILAQVDDVINKGPFAATWRSLEHARIPDWYKDAKFGIFIHWGGYSVAGFGNEWYPRAMYCADHAEFNHHIKTYGPQKTFGYKELLNKFDGARFDAKEWARLFRQAGARFVMPVAEHHDGFAMYDCGWSRWTATRLGPRRDVLGELSAAIRAEQMVFTASSHRAEHWWFFDEGRKFDSDVNDPAFADLYGPAQPRDTQPDAAFLDDWLARTCEIVLKYAPQIMYFDWCIEQPAFAPYLKRFAAFYYNWAAATGREVAINYKIEAFPPEAAVFDVERGQLAGLRPLFWQTDTAVSKKSWGYVADHDYKTTTSILEDFVDIISKNGALLLNIGPKPDGVIPDHERNMLLEIGRWMETYSEAIYGTRPWKLFGEGPTQVQAGSFTDTKREPFTSADIRYTSREDTIYAFGMVWPADGVMHLASLAMGRAQAPITIAHIKQLGSEKPLEFTRDAQGLHVSLPGQPPLKHPFAIRITPA